MCICEHGHCDRLPLFMQRLWIIEFSFAGVELLNFTQKLLFSFNMLEKLMSCKHFIQNESSTPYITFLIIRSQINNLWSSIQWSTSSFCHLNFNVSCQTKISDFQLFIFIKKYIIRF